MWAVLISTKSYPIEIPDALAWLFLALFMVLPIVAATEAGLRLRRWYRRRFTRDGRQLSLRLEGLSR